MYAIGTKIVHPSYGAGTIVLIQEKTLGECCNRYYIIETPPGPHKMRVMVPVNNADSIGLRPVGKAQQLRNLLRLAGTTPSKDKIIRDFRNRKAYIMEMLKSGSFHQVMQAVRMLHFIGTERPLSMTDRSLLDQGKQILASELALATGTTLDAAMEEIDTHLASMVSNPEQAAP